ncbi:hypothetical protein DOS58_00170, partial [Staphylococcus felis]|uniref:Ig-like domain-containing protein n=1 Tax=Staphylococcus felis TaxID=46127 RepID=UPI000E3ABC66
MEPVTSETGVIAGTGEEESKMTVHFPDRTTATGTVDEAGRYEVKMPDTVELKGGEIIKVTATDRARHTSEQTPRPVGDRTAPEAPTVEPVTSKTELITGTGGAENKV